MVGISIIVGVSAIFSGSTVYKVLVSILGLAIAVIQFAVAHNNSTGRWNFITRRILKLHGFLRRF